MEETQAEYEVEELHVHIGDPVYNTMCLWLSAWLGKITNLVKRRRKEQNMNIKGSIKFIQILIL